MKLKPSLIYLLGGIAVLTAVGVANHTGAFAPEPRRGKAQTFLGTPKPIDRERQVAIQRDVERRFRVVCEQDLARYPTRPEYAPILDAVAQTVCRRKDGGMRELKSWYFEDGDELAGFYNAIRNSLQGAEGSCSGSSGITRWAARDDDAPREDILCYVEDRNWVRVWSEHRASVVHMARGPDRDALAEWWERRVRPQPRYPTQLENHLLSIVEERISRDHCARDETGGSPMARAAVVCARVASWDMGNGQFFFELHTPATLATYVDDLLSDPELAVLPYSDDPCRQRSFERGRWRTDKRGGQGSLLCFPSGHHRVLAWTLEDKGLFGYAQLDTIDNPGTAYALWNEHLKGIGS